MHEPVQKEQKYSFKNYFIPFTTVKAVHWIIIIGILVYFNSLLNGFLGDDWGQLVYNIPVHSISNILYFFSSSTFYVNGAGTFGLYYKPLMMVAYSVLYTVFGANPLVYHLVQLIFHIANSCLLLLFFNKFFSKKISFLLVVLFLVHPINNESVVSIAALQEVLYFFFGIISLLLLQKKSKKVMFAIGFCWLLTLFSKETGILFITIALLYTWLFKYNKSYYLVALGVICIYLFFRFIAVGLYYQDNYLYIVSNLTFLQRMFSVPLIFFYYISHFIYPKDLVSSQQWIVRQITFGNFYVPLILDILFVIFLFVVAHFFLIKQKKLFTTYIFFLFWFLIGIGFYLQIIPLDTTVADRWFYFPIVGLLGIFGTVITYFFPKIKNVPIQRILLILYIFVIILFAVRTFVRTVNWNNDYSLCSHDTMINKDSYILELCMGNEDRKIKKYNSAIYHLKKSIALYPTYYPAMDYLALTYDDEGNYRKAIEYYTATLSNNNWGDGADMLATLLVYHGKSQQAKIVSEENLKKQPQNAQLWYALALAEYRMGDKQNALKSAENAYTLAPNSVTHSVFYGIQENLPIKFNGK